MVKYIATMILISLLWVAGPVAAAQVSAVPDRTRISEGESLNLELRVQGNADEDPDLSVLDQDWEILNRSRSSQVQIVNGDFSRSLVISLSLLPRRSGSLSVPAICFGGDCSIPQTIEVTEQQASRGGGDELLFEAAAEPEAVVVGEQVLLTIKVLHRVNLAAASLDKVEPQGVATEIESLGEDRSYQTRRDGYLYNVIERRYALFPREEGTLELPRMTLQAQVAAGGGFGSIGGRTKTLRRFASPIEIRVGAPPENAAGRTWLPAAQVTLEDGWQEQLPTFRVGEPVTRTLTLEARGLPSADLPDLQVPVPTGWKSYPDQPVRTDSTDSDGLTGTLQQKIALVPMQAGEVELPGFAIDWYDTGSEDWRQIEVAPLRVTVEPAPAGTVNPAVSPKPQAAPVPEPMKPAAGAHKEPPSADYEAIPVPAPGPGQTNFWPWVSLGLGVAWLVTLLLWWRQSRRQGSVTVETAGGKDLIREKEAFGKLLVAVRSNNPAATRQALVSWGQSRWPDMISNLEQLSVRLDEPLAAEILRLNRALYSRTPEDWQGDELARELKRWQGQKPGKEKKVDLPPLYPAGK